MTVLCFPQPLSQIETVSCQVGSDRDTWKSQKVVRQDMKNDCSSSWSAYSEFSRCCNFPISGLTRTLVFFAHFLYSDLYHSSAASIEEVVLTKSAWMVDVRHLKKNCQPTNRVIESFLGCESHNGPCQMVFRTRFLPVLALIRRGPPACIFWVRQNSPSLCSSRNLLGVWQTKTKSFAIFVKLQAEKFLFGRRINQMCPFQCIAA